MCEEGSQTWTTVCSDQVLRDPTHSAKQRSSLLTSVSLKSRETDEETARCQHSFVWEKEPAEGSPGRELDTAAYRLGVL
jgi:hypothetical protein